MQVRCEPSHLQITDENTVHCPRCKDVLQKEIRQGNSLLKECSQCNYDSRPFALCRSPFAESGSCTCEYEEIEYIHIICNTCIVPRCSKCSQPHRGICPSCKEKEFKDKWRTSTPQGKLHLYGVAKLRILAKNKQLTGYSKWTKDELIARLTPIVHDTDYPIQPA